MAGAYTVTKISHDHYRIAENNVFMDLLIGSEGALLIDTGFGFGDLRKTVRSLTDLPLTVVNTHGHPDHACENWQFTETAWMNSRDYDLCRMYNTPQARQAAMGTEMPEDFLEEGYLAGGTGPVAFTWEGQIFALGGLSLEVVDLPGHTGGSIGLLDRAGKRLFVGDAMNKALFLFQKGVAQKRSVYIETLKKVRTLPAEMLWAGHTAKPMPLQSSVMCFLHCAEEADFAQAFPCGHMLGTDNVRLFVTESCRSEIDPENLMYSIYATGIQDRENFCSIFLSEDTM